MEGALLSHSAVPVLLHLRKRKMVGELPCVKKVYILHRM